MRNVLACALAVAAVCPTSAVAETYTATLTGTIAAPSAYFNAPRDDRGLIPGLAAGQEFTATYYYDHTALSSFYASNPSNATNWFPFSRATFTVGGSTMNFETNGFYQYLMFSGEPSGNQSMNFIFNVYPPGDYLSLAFTLTGTAGQLFSGSSNIFVTGGDLTLVQNTQPLFAPDQRGSLTGSPFTGGSNFLFAGLNPTRLVVAAESAVPEPATWAMMMLGFGLIGAGVRRQRTSYRVSFA